MLPALFVSHGAPSLPFDDVPARDFLRGLGREIGKPRAILMVSAHWDTEMPQAASVAVNDTIHDFAGFAKTLYDIRYPAPGDALLAREVTALTGGKVDTMRGLDHGAWVPLMLMYPRPMFRWCSCRCKAARRGASHRAGPQHRSARQDDVLVMGSGGFVHNLRHVTPPGAPEPNWSKAFSDWMHDRRMAGDETALTAYRKLAPDAVLAQPSEDHFMPLFVALGAGGETAKATRLHSSTTFGSLRMDAYSFS